MISAVNVSKLYGPTAAVSNVSLDVAAGEAVAVGGPPGSGRTTLLRLLGSWLEPSSGTIQICGLDAQTQLWQARSRLSYVASNAVVGTALTVDEYLRFVTRTRGRTNGTKRTGTPIGEVLAQAQLSPAARVDALTAGGRAALALAAVLVAPSDVVLIDRALDELDPSTRDAFGGQLLESRRRGAALVVVTDDPGRQPELYHRVFRLNAGQIAEVTVTPVSEVRE